MLNGSRLTRRAALSAGLGVLAAPVLAQPAWPMARPIEVIVGFAPGGGTDVMVRALVQMVAAELPGANFVIANRPGAGGETAYVATQGARPDGYTIGTINTPGYISVGIERRVRYDRARIRPIARLVEDPVSLVVRQASPYRTLQDLVADARRRPGAISVSSSGVGTSAHLGLTLFQAASGTEFIHAPFAGSGPAKNALIAGHLDVGGITLGEIGVVGQENPQFRALGAMAGQRWDLMPEVPTMRELGFDVLMASERGFGAPRDMPDEYATRLEDTMARVIATPDWAERARRLELPMAFLRGADWEAQMPAQEARYRRIWETTPWQ